MFQALFSQYAPYIIGGFGILLVLFGDKAVAWLKTLKLPSLAGGATSTDPDVVELKALKLVQARFVRNNCAEGKAAALVMFEHFFHKDGQ